MPFARTFVFSGDKFLVSEEVFDTLHQKTIHVIDLPGISFSNDSFHTFDHSNETHRQRLLSSNKKILEYSFDAVITEIEEIDHFKVDVTAHLNSFGFSFKEYAQKEYVFYRAEIENNQYLYTRGLSSERQFYVTVEELNMFLENEDTFLDPGLLEFFKRGLFQKYPQFTMEHKGTEHA